MATTAPSDDVVGAISKKGKSSTLTREADPPPPLPTVAVNKPQVPAKPAHIRPGLKPVKIPTVDDKVWVSTIHDYLINFLIDSSNHFFFMNVMQIVLSKYGLHFGLHIVLVFYE